MASLFRFIFRERSLRISFNGLSMATSFASSTLPSRHTANYGLCNKILADFRCQIPRSFLLFNFTSCLLVCATFFSSSETGIRDEGNSFDRLSRRFKGGQICNKIFLEEENYIRAVLRGIQYRLNISSFFLRGE